MIRSKNGGSGSDVEEASEESMMEVELARLQRSYRVMQNDYRAYKEETKRIINKQDMLIEQLEKEREELDTMLGKMETTQNKGKDEQNTKKLAELSASDKEYHSLIGEERDKIKTLDEEMLMMEKQIADKRKLMGGMNHSTSLNNAIAKKKCVLENRLDKAVVHFNRQLATNSDLRADIDHFRQERAVFENLYKRLSRELSNCKKEMSDVIATSTQAFEQRDEAQTKMLALKERSEKDHQQYLTEMKDLLRMISHDNKIKEFMNIKASDRSEYKVEEAAKRKRDEKGVDADRATVKIYEDAFQRIQEVMQEEDLGVIVDTFIRREHENFALFNYVNELNSEVETLQEEVQGVRREIECYKEEENQMEGRRTHIIKDIENRYRKAEGETNHAEMRLREVNKMMDQLRSGVEQMFTHIGCDAKPIKEMLGGESGINNKNIMIYLGQVEHRTSKLLNVIHYMKLKKSQVEGGPPPKLDSNLPVPGIHTLDISPPGVGDDLVNPDGDSDEDDETRPLTLDELRMRVTRDLERRPHPGATGTPHQPYQKSIVASTKEKPKKKGPAKAAHH